MESLRGKAAGAQEPDPVRTKLERIAALGRRFPDRAFTSLAHHMDTALIREANRRTRKDGATGVDRETGKAYQEDLEAKLADLHGRAKSGRYWAPPVRRTHIPKGNGPETRPLGIPTYEDKVLQRAVAMILGALYEQDFLDGSYGFRPGRSAHQALESLWREVMNMQGCWIVEVDIRKFFDTLDHAELRKLLQRRVLDGVLLRLIDKWLAAGVMEEGRITRSDTGTPQGGVISPLLANVYLHYVLDLWVEEEVRPRLKGRMFLIRYADDFILGFDRETDARRVMEVLPKRFAKHGLTTHPDKTRLVDFRRPDPKRPSGPGTFDFLGFTHHWGKSRKGRPMVARRTANSRLRRTLDSISNWCKEHRHEKVSDQRKTLEAKLRGHYAYYGITGNMLLLRRLFEKTKRIWRTWLDRRGQGRTLPWERFASLLSVHPLPPPRIVHSALRAAANP